MSKWFVCICCVCYFSVSYAQEFNLGIAAHLLSNNPSSLNPNTANTKIKAAGIRYVRMDALWRDVEINKGQLAIPKKWDEVINEQKKLGLEPILRIIKMEINRQIKTALMLMSDMHHMW